MRRASARYIIAQTDITVPFCPRFIYLTVPRVKTRGIHESEIAVAKECKQIKNLHQLKCYESFMNKLFLLIKIQVEFKLIFCTNFDRITVCITEKLFNAEWKYVSPINVIPNFFFAQGDSH